MPGEKPCNGFKRRFFGKSHMFMIAFPKLIRFYVHTLPPGEGFILMLSSTMTCQFCRFQHEEPVCPRCLLPESWIDENCKEAYADIISKLPTSDKGVYEAHLLSGNESFGANILECDTNEEAIACPRGYLNG